MVRVNYSSQYKAGDVLKSYVEAAGLSTDTKPDNVITGSIFVEVDTGKVFMYDEVGESWVEEFSLQG